MIKTLRIEGFRSLRSVELELKNLNVLVGRNDTGKTNVLEALQRLSSLTSGRTDESWRSFDNDCWADAARKSVSYSLTDRSLFYKLHLVDHGGCTIVREELGAPGHALLWPNPKGKVDFLKNNKVTGKLQKPPFWTFMNALSDDAERWAMAAPAIEPMKRTLESWHIHSLHPSDVRRKSAPVSRSCWPEPGGYGIPAIVDYLYREDRDRFALIEEALRQFAPGVRSIVPREEVEPGASEDGRVVWKKLAFRLTNPDCTVDASQVSEGVILVLAWLVIAFLSDEPSLIMIDEPENGIHPHALEMLMKVLHALSRGELDGVPACQVIMTTHSPYLLDHVRLDEEDELFVLERGEDGATACHAVGSKPWIGDLVPPYLLGEAWTNFGEDGLIGDAAPEEP